MPHTNKNKKRERQKRKEIIDENGWTRVTSGPKTYIENVAIANGLDEALQPTITPQEAPEDMTLEKLIRKYTTIQARWEHSQTCRVLKNTLKSRVVGGESKIRNCVVFGTGTPSGLLQGWIDRTEIALYQIAAFLTVVDAIEEVQGKRPPAFAQEPNYNNLDEAFLSSLSITKVNHPTGFCLLTPRTFAYCPCAEQFVTLRTLIFDPAIYVGGYLDLARRRDGSTYADMVENHYEIDGKWMTLEDVEDLPEKKRYQNMVRTGRQRMLEKSSTVEAYTNDKEFVRLPDLENVKDYPFYEHCLYWRPAGVEEQTRAIPWPTLLGI